MSRRATRTWIRAGVLALLLSGSAFAVFQFRKSRETSADLPSAAAKKQDFLVLVKCRGELGAAHSVQITAPLDAPDLQIVWLAPPGSAVTTGQTVIKFDPSKSLQELKEKESALRQAQAALDQQVALERNAAEQDKLDLAKAQYDLERAHLESSKQAIVSVIQGQESVIDEGIAAEKLKVQRTATKLHEASNAAKIASLARLRDEAKSQVEITQRRLGLMELKSPLNGVINYLTNTTQGWMNAQPFKVGDHAVPGGSVAEVPDLTTIQMESKVEEVDRGRIAVGNTVLVHIDAFPEKVVQAKLTLVSPLTESSVNEWPPTRSFRAYAQLDELDPRFRPGMNATADIVETRIPGAIAIPAKALFTVHGKPSVYVKKDGVYLPIDVSVKARNPDEIAVEGIAAGTLVALTDPTLQQGKK